jgi:WD40 repeat protein
LIEDRKMKCPFCGMENDPDAVYCTGCGNDFPVPGGSIYKPPEEIKEWLSRDGEEEQPEKSDFNSGAYSSFSASGFIAPELGRYPPAPGYAPSQVDIGIENLPEVKAINFFKLVFIAAVVLTAGFLLAGYLFREKSPYDNWEITKPMDNMNEVTSYSISQSGTFFAESCADKVVKIWTIRPLEKKMEVRYMDRPFCTALSSSSGLLAVSGEDLYIKLYNPLNLNLVKKFKAHDGTVFCMAFSPDGNRLVSGGGDGKVKIWNMISYSDSKTIPAHDGDVYTIAFSPDGRYFASGGKDGKVHIYNALENVIITTLPTAAGAVFTVTFSPDGKTVVTGGDDSDIEFWDILTGNHIRTLSGHKRGIGDVKFSPDGNYLFSAGKDKTLKIWSMKSFKCVKTFKFEIDAFPLDVSPDNDFILCGRNLTVIRDGSKFK